MSESKETTTTNGASHPDHVAKYEAWAAALEPRDRSLEIACHLGNAKAIADLIFIVCGGSSANGEDSRIDELARNTLSTAAYCIMENVAAADELYHEALACERMEKVAKASTGH
jgi:hypothetical protein